MPNTELQKYKYFSALATPALNYFTVSKLKSNFKSRSALGAASFRRHLVINSYICFFICKRATPCREERTRPDKNTNLTFLPHGQTALGITLLLHDCHTWLRHFRFNTFASF